MPFKTSIKKATSFSFTVLRKWTDAPQKWLEAKDINGSSIFRLEESRGPHECHMRSASHFLWCWFGFVSNKIGNNYFFFHLLARIRTFYIIKHFICIYHLPGGHFLLKDEKILIVLHSTLWKLSVSFAICSSHVTETHTLYFLNKIGNFTWILKILYWYTFYKLLVFIF